MVPPPITEDYYLILEVSQTATLEQITRSYRRLALKIHPDRNAKDGATQAFQLLVAAYDTLKDADKRRQYDLIYPSISQSRPRTNSSNTQTPPKPQTSTPRAEAVSEAAQIAQLRKTKEERFVRWTDRQKTFDASIAGLQQTVDRLVQDIKNLTSIAKAEAAVEASKNSWTTWMLSPLYKRKEESEEGKERKSRERQERRIEKDLKERRLQVQKAKLREEQDRLMQAKKDVDVAAESIEQSIRSIEAKIRAREGREREERERVEREKEAERERAERERQAEAWAREAEVHRKWYEAEQARQTKQWQEQQEQQARLAREAAEALRKRQAEVRAAETARQEESRRKQKAHDDEMERRHRWDRVNGGTQVNGRGSAHQVATPSSVCTHRGWWDKVEGRTGCPACGESWSYLLECPNCEMQACPKCQYNLRHGLPTGSVCGGFAPRPKAPKPAYYGDHWN